MALDVDPPRKKRKQKEPLNKEDSSQPSLHGPCDPNLGIRLEDAVETRAQQAQNRARNEQTPLKERIDRSNSAIEGQDSSSAVDDSAIEGQDSSSAADDIAIEGQDSSSAADKRAIESPDSSSACGNGNEGLPQDEKSNQSLPLKPFSSRKPVTNWADEISEGSEEDVDMDNQSVRNSSAIRADYAAIRAELNPGFSVVNPEDAIVRVSSSSTNNVGACHISVANLFLSQSKENSPSASPLRERDSEPHRSVQNRTELNRSEPNRTEPVRTEPNRSEPNRTEPVRTEPNRTG
jgi:hypothetical protein